MKQDRYFYFDCNVNDLKNFEKIREYILNRKHFRERDIIIQQMLIKLSQKDQIKAILDADSNYFKRPGLNWEMEYKIAAGILEYELNKKDLMYFFEITNYIFYFLLLPQPFKCTFFLMQGIHIKNDVEIRATLNLDKCEEYVIYARSKNLLTTYKCTPSEIHRTFIERTLNEFEKNGISMNYSPSSDVIFIQFD